MFVSVSSALSVCSYSDYTDNSLRALSKLFMCKSCTDNLSVQNRCTGTHTHTHTQWHTNAKDGPSSLYESDPVHRSFAEAYVCCSVPPRLCESRSLSHRLKRCNSIYLPFTNVTLNTVCVCCAATALVFVHNIKAL